MYTPRSSLDVVISFDDVLPLIKKQLLSVFSILHLIRPKGLSDKDGSIAMLYAIPLIMFTGDDEEIRAGVVVADVGVIFPSLSIERDV